MITMHDDTPMVAPATPTTTLGWAWPDAVLGFLGVHLGLRAEAAAVAELVERGDLRRAAQRARLLARVLGEHHRVEDELLWPALEVRRPDFADARFDLELQHVQLDAALEDLCRDPRTIERLIPLLVDHLQAEESLALPVWLATFTAEDHVEFEQALRRSTPLRDIGTMLSWLFDVTPHDVRPLATSRVPAALRWAHQVVFRHLYTARYGRHGALCCA